MSDNTPPEKSSSDTTHSVHTKGNRPRTPGKPPRQHDHLSGKPPRQHDRPSGKSGKPDPSDRHGPSGKPGFSGKPAKPGFSNKRAPLKPQTRDAAPDAEEIQDEFALSPKMKGTVDALIALDDEIMKLLVRRATLVSRIHEGKEHASSPSAILAEKTVRLAWEKAAPSFSRDQRFARQLFSLLQDVKVMTKEEAPKGSFRLTPANAPVSGAITAPVSAEAVQMWVTLACSTGQKTTIRNIPLSTPVSDCIKTFSQIGATIAWEPSTNPMLGSITVNSTVKTSFAGRSVYLGESVFGAYLAAFVAAGTVGTCRFTGGTTLKNHNFSSLRQALPLLGARLAHVIPHTHGLPANLECSGALPAGLTIPANLPLEGVCALLLAPLLWNTPIAINLEALPALDATTALARVEPFFQQCNATVHIRGPLLNYEPADLLIPDAPTLPLDSQLCAYLLALPAFTGGNISLFGKWPGNEPAAVAAQCILQWAGLSLSFEKEFIRSTKGKASSTPLVDMSVPSGLAPLLFSLAACTGVQQHCHKDIGNFIQFEDDDPLVAAEMLDRIGFTLEGSTVAQLATKEKAPSQPWTSPTPYWAMAYALCAFLRPGIKLANPMDVTTLMPSFWSLYNSLPALCEDEANPADSAAFKNEVQAYDPAARPKRRIVTD